MSSYSKADVEFLMQSLKLVTINICIHLYRARHKQDTLESSYVLRRMTPLTYQYTPATSMIRCDIPLTKIISRHCDIDPDHSSKAASYLIWFVYFLLFPLH